MKATVAIPTYGRAKRLRETLATVTAQDFPADQYEILVIDNNSPDDTAAVVAEFAQARPAPRRIVETRQGLDHARNRSIAEARGEILVLADDDILAGPAWLSRLLEPFAASTCVAAVGGEVVPVFPDGLPDWIREWHSPLAFRTEAGPLPARHSPMGANLAVRRSVFSEIGLFQTNLDRSASNYFSGGDSELIRRIRAAGHEVWFAPAAVVRHQMPASRTTFRYAARHAFDSARSRVIDRVQSPGARAYLASRLIVQAAKAGGCALLAAACAATLQHGAAKKALVRGWRSCGYVYQILRSARGKV